jgi:hypothetical protein
MFLARELMLLNIRIRFTKNVSSWIIAAPECSIWAVCFPISGQPMSTVAFLHAPPSVGDRQKKAGARIASSAGIFAEVVSFDELTRLTVPWADLVTRALEPNVFLEPAFAIPLFQHCHSRKNLQFLLAWVQDGPNAQHQLIGLLPLTLPALFFSSFAHSAAHPLAPLGTPLFDRDKAQEALRHMILWFQDYHPRVRGLVLPLIPKDGATFAMLQEHEAATKNKLAVFKQHLRAVLSKVVGAQAFPNGFISTKRRNNYRQQRRRLSQRSHGGPRGGRSVSFARIQRLERRTPDGSSRGLGRDDIFPRDDASDGA